MILFTEIMLQINFPFQYKSDVRGVGPENSRYSLNQSDADQIGQFSCFQFEFPLALMESLSDSDYVLNTTLSWLLLRICWYICTKAHTVINKFINSRGNKSYIWWWLLGVGEIKTIITSLSLERLKLWSSRKVPFKDDIPL